MDKSDFFVVNGGRYQESIFDEDRRITYAEYGDEMYNDTPYKTMYMLKNHKEDRMLAFQLLPADKRQEIISQNGLTVDELIEVIESEPCKAVRDEAWKRYDEIPDPEQEKNWGKGLDR